MAEMTVHKVLQYVIDKLELGYSEGPINTPGGGGLAIVYSTHPANLESIEIPRGWKISQKFIPEERLLQLFATPRIYGDEIVVKRDPIPGDIVVVGSGSWLGKTMEILRIEEKYYWVRVPSGGDFPWRFYSVRKPIVAISASKEDRDFDPVLETHILWARLSKDFKEFLAKFDA